MDLKDPADRRDADSAQPADLKPVQPTDPDFRVLKTGAATWKMVAVSPRARDFMHRNLALGDDDAQAGMVFTDHRGVNDLILDVRTRGYTTDLIGPRGPMRM